MSSVKALEQQLGDFKESIALRDQILKLTDNADFRKVILDTFMVQEAARYAHTSADPALNEIQRADALALAQAGGHLKRWLSIAIRMGNSAEDQLVDLNESIEEARAGEDS